MPVDPTTPQSVSDRFAQVSERLALALADAGRDPAAARLLAVSKTQPADRLRALYQAGQRAFGENYLQEALGKQAMLSDLDIEWHFIGPIQSNKTRDIAEHFDWVHSIDREKIAQRLNDQRPSDLPLLDVCLQVNVSQEQSKSGVAPEALLPLAQRIAAMPRLRLRGLMAIPEPCDDPVLQRAPFARLRALFESLRAELPQAPLDTLSMGMSADLEAAITEGATMVRIGTAIFGPREYPSGP
ncbi:YggS family pyridoxal phosphate-dependent enzyme [Halotalea alkalilenta]|uniref:Pyridoxal phosphate homeostasis protein n=1 Tax=Halotalea alkalilenta TaxID=376489 RepID=A0A172Y9Z4_9GAMM|nr:YggS family pyridoxal phosphate-dependent enzyme [Halotalea alkalilenta]ANF56053.1 YggS family pyridoxal phosphate enzyme [Halotalea alkalilenta]